jgi:hypothetical protein
MDDMVIASSPSLSRRDADDLRLCRTLARLLADPEPDSELDSEAERDVERPLAAGAGTAVLPLSYSLIMDCRLSKIFTYWGQVRHVWSSAMVGGNKFEN